MDGPDAFAIVTTQWHYGDLTDLPKLRAILEVGGRHPSPASIDYDHCRVKGIRVLSCAPAFGPMVAEMALGMAIDAAREITAGHEAFRAGDREVPLARQREHVHVVWRDGRVDRFWRLGAVPEAATGPLRLSPYRSRPVAYGPILEGPGRRARRARRVAVLGAGDLRAHDSDHLTLRSPIRARCPRNAAPQASNEALWASPSGAISHPMAFLVRGPPSSTNRNQIDDGAAHFGSVFPPAT